MDIYSLGVIKSRLANLRGTAFQEIIDGIYSVLFKDDYKSLKQKHDKGSDGLFESTKTSIACYAPESHDLRSFKNKINDDYAAYMENWGKQYPWWQVITNLEVTANMLQHVKSKSSAADLKGINEIVSQINNSTLSQQYKIFELLGLDTGYFKLDIIRLVVTDIINECDLSETRTKYEMAIYIEDKFRLNCTADEVTAVISAFDDAVENFISISKTLKEQNTSSVNALREKIKSKFNQLNGSFLEKLDAMVDDFSKNSSDDVYRCYLKYLLLYFFEQCLFGLKTEAEKC